MFVTKVRNVSSYPREARNATICGGGRRIGGTDGGECAGRPGPERRGAGTIGGAGRAGAHASAEGVSVEFGPACAVSGRRGGTDVEGMGNSVYREGAGRKLGRVHGSRWAAISTDRGGAGAD